MDRRVLVVPGAILLGLSLLAPGVVHWQATLHATPGDPTHPTVNASSLPAECGPTIDSLAAGRTVTVEGYRFLPETLDVAVERTSATDGWRLADANCADRLAFVGDLRVGNRSYDVEGRYSERRLDRTPPFRRVRLVGVLLGAGLLVAGALEVLGREAG